MRNCQKTITYGDPLMVKRWFEKSPTVKNLTDIQKDIIDGKFRKF